MSNPGIPPALRIARERARAAVNDARWWLIVAVQRRIDRFVFTWQERNRGRE